MRAEQGHKSAGDTQFIQLLRRLYVQVYRAKKNVNASNESPQLRVKLRAVAGTVTDAVAGTVTGAVAVKLTKAQSATKATISAMPRPTVMVKPVRTADQKSMRTSFS